MSDVKVYDQNALTARDVKAQVNRIQEVLETVMKKDIHYGTIPGCKKPSLWKPGAEKIAVTFHLAPDPQVEDLSIGDIIRFRVRCELLVMPDNRFVGAGIGECSTEEDKYKWRKAVSKKEFEATDESNKRIKYGYQNSETEQVRTNIYDLSNTILKMAKKRALVDAVLTATAASDIFDQDLEDLPEGYDINAGQEQKPPIKESSDKPADKIELKKMQKKLWDLMNEQCRESEDPKKCIESLLHSLTTFEVEEDGQTKTIQGKTSILKVSEKQAQTAYGKLKEMMKKPEEKSGTEPF
jgi:hypothetical protein